MMHTTKTDFNSDSESLTVRFLGSVITISMVMIYFGVPLFFTSITMQGILFDKAIYFYFWVLLMAVAWATRGAIRGRLSIPRTPLDIPIIILLAVTIISTFLSVDRWHSIWGAFGDPSRGLVMLVAMIVLYYILIEHFNRERFYWIFGAFLLSGSIVAMWTFLGLLNIPFLPKSIIQYVPLNTIGTFKDLATFFTVLIPLIITGIFALWQDSVVDNTRKLWRIIISVLLGIVLAVMLINLFSLFNYVTWSAVVVSVFFFLMYILAHIVRPYNALVWIPMLVVVIVAGFLMIGGYGNNGYFVHVQLPIELNQKADLAWNIAKSSVKENPALGSGPATYSYVFSLFRPEIINNSSLFTARFSQGGNVVFDTLATIGISGLIAFMIVVLTYIGISVYLLSSDKEYNKVGSLGFVSALLAVIVTMIVGQSGNEIIALLIVILGFSVLLDESRVPPRKIDLSLTVSPRFALTMAFISIVVITGVGASFFYVGKVFVADVYAGKAIRQQRVSQESLQYLMRSVRLYPQEKSYMIRLAQEYAVLANRELLKPDSERNVANLRIYLDSASEAARVAFEQMPYSVVAAESYAQILENRSNYANLSNPETVLISTSDAQEAYKAAQKLEPQNPIYLMKRGELEMRRAVAFAQQKKEEESKKALKEANELFTQSIEKKKNFAPAYYQRAISYEALKDLDNAIKDAETAVYLTQQSNINYVFYLGRLYQSRGTDTDNARAEVVFRSILGVNDKEINTHFSLATLYTKTKIYNAAIEEYQKVIELLPENDTQNKKRIEEIISRIQSSGSRVESLGDAVVSDGNQENVATSQSENQENPEDEPLGNIAPEDTTDADSGSEVQN